MRSLARASFAGVFALALACGNGDSGSESECIPGDLYCECNQGACLAGLVCSANICVGASGDGDTSDGSTGDGEPGDGDGDTGDGDGDGDTGDGDGAPGDGDGDTGDGDGAPGDGDGEGCGTGEQLCNGVCTNVMEDDANCGDCGNVCDIAGNTGGCDNGTCAPALSECINSEDPPKSCDEICSEFGKTCVSLGCNGMTYSWYGSLNMCAQFAGDPNQNDCSHPMALAGAVLRCCCQ